MASSRRSLQFPTGTRTAVVVAVVVVCLGVGHALVTTSEPLLGYVFVTLWYATLVGLPTVLLLRHGLVSPVVVAAMSVVRPAVFEFDFGRLIGWPGLFATVLAFAGVELFVRSVLADRSTAFP
jgi:hypothetical protein